MSALRVMWTWVMLIGQQTHDSGATRKVCVCVCGEGVGGELTDRQQAAAGSSRQQRLDADSSGEPLVV